MVLRWSLIAILTALLLGGAAAQTNPPQAVEIPSGTSQGLLISKVQPTYPPLARQARVQGTVVLRALIAKDGSMEDLTVVSGHPMLVQAALDAVKQWRYKPYLVDGKPVEVETTINVNFQLSEVPPEEWPSEPPEDSDLKPYTTCDLGPDFRIVQVDGPVKNFAWPSPTKNGEVHIPVEVGYRVLITYMEEERFGNLKVERLPKSKYIDAKANLLDGLQFLATEPGMEPTVQTVIRNGFTIYGATHNKLEGGTLSIYYLFLEDKSVLISMYLLNAEPRWRLFNTIEEYKKIRDQFLDVYSKCVALAQKPARAEVGTSSQTQTHASAVNPSAADSGGSNPRQMQQAGHVPMSAQSPSVYLMGRDMTPPKATYAPDPQYSEEARKARFEGTVVLWLVVDADGLPQKIKVQRSLGMGLDEQAIKAVSQWRFQPATKNGTPVPVIINVEVNFRLYDELYPHPDSARQPPRFPGVDISEYPLIVRRNASNWRQDTTGVTLSYSVTVQEAGQERQVSISCQIPSPDCSALNEGTYPAKWHKDMSTIEILGLPQRNDSQAKWTKAIYQVATDKD